MPLIFMYACVGSFVSGTMAVQRPVSDLPALPQSTPSALLLRETEQPAHSLREAHVMRCSAASQGANQIRALHVS